MVGAQYALAFTRVIAVACGLLFDCRYVQIHKAVSDWLVLQSE